MAAVGGQKLAKRATKSSSALVFGSDDQGCTGLRGMQVASFDVTTTYHDARRFGDVLESPRGGKALPVNKESWQLGLPWEDAATALQAL